MFCCQLCGHDTIKRPDCITSTERNKVYTVPLLSQLLLFIYFNSRLTSGDKGEESTPSPGCIQSAGILDTGLLLWSLPQIQQAVKSTDDGDRDRPLWALSTGQWAVDKSRVCLARPNSSPIPLVLAFLPHYFEPLVQHVRLYLIMEVFQVNIISPLEFKLVCLDLNSTLITLLPAPSLSFVWSVFIQLPPPYPTEPHWLTFSTQMRVVLAP